MKYDILSVYGDIKIFQNVCKKCGCRFFILGENEYDIFCEDCRKEFNSLKATKILNLSKRTKIIFHCPIYKRKYIPLKIKIAVYERDNYRCVYCDKDLHNDFINKTGYITVDHFIPYIGRGEDMIKNLYTCCKKCNSSKYSKLFSSVEEVRDYILFKSLTKSEKLKIFREIKHE